MTQHDYKATLDRFVKNYEEFCRMEKAAPEMIKDCATTIHALRIAEKLMQEPSEEMVGAAVREFNTTQQTSENDYAPIVAEFKAMREQMLKEIGE